MSFGRADSDELVPSTITSSSRRYRSSFKIESPSTTRITAPSTTSTNTAAVT
jgi:hypothetical protein